MYKFVRIVRSPYLVSLIFRGTPASDQRLRIAPAGTAVGQTGEALPDYSGLNLVVEIGGGDGPPGTRLFDPKALLASATR